MEIKSFTDIDQIFAHIRSREEYAATRMAPEQLALTWGSYVVHFDAASGLVIFGRILTQEEIRTAETDLGADDAEVEFEIEQLTDSHVRGYLFGWHYSTWEVAGELGSTHRMNCWPISDVLFQVARLVGWDISQLDPINAAELADAAKAYSRHMLAVTAKDFDEHAEQALNVVKDES